MLEEGGGGWGSPSVETSTSRPAHRAAAGSPEQHLVCAASALRTRDDARVVHTAPPPLSVRSNPARPLLAGTPSLSHWLLQRRLISGTASL